MKNITALTDDELRAQILAFGIDAGPVLKSTRRVYQIKLEKLLSEVSFESKTQTLFPETALVQEPKRKLKAAVKVVEQFSEPESVESEPPEEQYQDDLDQTNESHGDFHENGVDLSPEPEDEIPEIIPPIRYEPKIREIREPNLRHSLPDYKRPPLNSSWRELDLSTDYQSPGTSLTQRREARTEREETKSEVQSTKEKKIVQKRSKLSTCLQILVFLIFAVLIFFIFTNMEPANENPFQKALPGK